MYIYIYTIYLVVQKRSNPRDVHQQKIGVSEKKRTETPHDKTPYVPKFILSTIARASIAPSFPAPLTSASLAVSCATEDPFVVTVAVPFAPTSYPLATPFPLINFSPSSSLRKSIPLAGLSSLFPLLLLGPPAQLIGLRLLNRLVIPPPMPAALHLFLCGAGVSSSPSSCRTTGISA